MVQQQRTHARTHAHSPGRKVLTEEIMFNLCVAARSERRARYKAIPYSIWLRESRSLQPKKMRWRRARVCVCNASIKKERSKRREKERTLKKRATSFRI